MKNLALTSGLTIGGVLDAASAFQTMFFHDGIMDIVFQEDFTPLKLQRLPLAVLEAVNNMYGEEKIQNVYYNELKEYKIEVLLDENLHVVYTDENGHWITK